MSDWGTKAFAAKPLAKKQQRGIQAAAAEKFERDSGAAGERWCVMNQSHEHWCEQGKHFYRHPVQGCTVKANGESCENHRKWDCPECGETILTGQKHTCIAL